MIDVPAVRVEDVRETPDIAVMPWHDLQDGPRLVVLEGDTVRGVSDLLHAVQDLDATADRREVGGVCMQEERRHDPRVLDSMRAPLVPEPEDHRVAVVIPVRVDDPTVRERAPPPSRGPGDLLRRREREVGESAREEDLVGSQEHPHLDREPAPVVPPPQYPTRHPPDPEGPE